MKTPDYQYALFDAAGNSKHFSGDLESYTNNEIVQTLRDVRGSYLAIYRLHRIIGDTTQTLPANEKDILP